MKSLEEIEKTDPLIAPPITVSSWYTKHALESLNPTIAVMRHPDHLPDQQTINSTLASAFKNVKLTPESASKLPSDALKAIYGVAEDSILYWAHHEKLCVVDGKLAFMGGLDLCYGRWDTNQHSIADAHPGDINKIIFPGQDYNNARIMDFTDVQHWQNNKLDRTEFSRMGWTDISLSLHGEIVEDLKEHFVQRWNFIYDEKMESRDDAKYAKLTHYASPGGYQNVSEEGGIAAEVGELKHHLKYEVHKLHDKFEQHKPHWPGEVDALAVSQFPQPGAMSCQIVRSCTTWSHGVPLQVSICKNITPR
jgi:phospholipase D1/2